MPERAFDWYRRIIELGNPFELQAAFIRPRRPRQCFHTRVYCTAPAASFKTRYLIDRRKAVLGVSGPKLCQKCAIETAVNSTADIAVEAFFGEHRRSGELDTGVEAGRVG